MRDSTPAPAAPPKPASKLLCLPCLALLFLSGLGAAGLTVGLFEVLKSSVPYQEGLARAQADPRVQEAVGQPVRAGWWVSGSIEDRGPRGTATLVIPLEGPRGKATLQLAASKSEGLWKVERSLLSLAPEGTTLDLLEGPADPSRGPRPGPGPGASPD